MRLDLLANSIGAQVITRPQAQAPEVRGVYAGDRISDLLEHADNSTLLVSNLNSRQLVRLAELMDVPGICLVDSAQPEPELIESAREHETLLMVSPLGMFETCGRLYESLKQES